MRTIRVYIVLAAHLEPGDHTHSAKKLLLLQCLRYHVYLNRSDIDYKWCSKCGTRLTSFNREPDGIPIRICCTGCILSQDNLHGVTKIGGCQKFIIIVTLKHTVKHVSSLFLHTFVPLFLSHNSIPLQFLEV